MFLSCHQATANETEKLASAVLRNKSMQFSESIINVCRNRLSYTQLVKNT